MKKQNIPTPKADPRGYSNLQGKPLDVDTHPLNIGHPLSTQVLGDTYNALGPKTTYQQETRQMGDAVDVSETVPRKDK